MTDDVNLTQNGGCQTGSKPISSCSSARSEIPKVFPGILRTPDSMEVVSTQSRDCGHHFREMSAVKPEVSITLLVGVIETKFQKRF